MIIKRSEEEEQTPQAPLEPSFIVRYDYNAHTHMHPYHIYNPHLGLRPKGPCNKIDCMSEKEKERDPK